jgi:hypothetical protein
VPELLSSAKVGKFFNRVEFLPYPGKIEQNNSFVFNHPGMAAGMQFEKGRRSGAHRGAFEWI